MNNSMNLMTKFIIMSSKEYFFMFKIELKIYM